MIKIDMEVYLEKNMKVYASSEKAGVAYVSRLRKVNVENVDLLISVVIYQQNPVEFRETIRSLKSAVCYSVMGRVVKKVALVVMDNGAGQSERQEISKLLEQELEMSQLVCWELISANINLGYGRAHNIAGNGYNSKYHLVLNPDIDMARDAISQAFQFMEKNKIVGLLSPYAENELGQRQYLCKAYPNVFDLFLRGFAPRFICLLFDKRLARYEMRGKTEKKTVKGAEIVSGCFMFLRTSVLKSANGFSPRFFLFFEDFDLSLRISKLALIAYVPAVQIRHYGGHTTKRGLRRIALFLRSGITFFSIHGWKWF